MIKRLPQRVAQAAKPESKPYQLHDTIISGFILRMQPNGKKVWKLIQNKRPVSLGNFPQMTYAMAEDKVKKILSGEHEEVKGKVPTVKQFLEQYFTASIEANHSRPRETIDYIRRFKMDNTPLNEISLMIVERAGTLNSKKKSHRPLLTQLLTHSKRC